MDTFDARKYVTRLRYGMVNISNRDWTDFVAEVRSRLDVIDANIASNRTINDAQHQQLISDFQELKDELVGKDPTSLTNRVRSLEDSRTKMNGVQLGLSFAFSALTGVIAWLLGHPSFHLSMNDATTKIQAAMAAVLEFFGRKS